jgi:hypothetical protein
VSLGFEAYFTSKGIKDIKSGAFNAITLARERQNAKSVCRQSVAKVFMKLLKAGTLPSWVCREVNLELMEMAANG